MKFRCSGKVTTGNVTAGAVSTCIETLEILLKNKNKNKKQKHYIVSLLSQRGWFGVKLLLSDQSEL